MGSQRLSLGFALLTVLSSIFRCSFAFNSSTYQLDTEYSGANFFDGFDFFTGGDPTGGSVLYYSRSAAQKAGLISSSDSAPTYIGADYTNTMHVNAQGSIDGPGRPSVRISTKRTWTHALFIGDFAHIPAGVCGIWPAFWSEGPVWPTHGEVDIFESVNQAVSNGMAMHTNETCIISPTSNSELGTLGNTNCAYYPDYNVGCGVVDDRPASYSQFNSNGGGIFAMQWTSEYIKIWFFPRSQIPADIISKQPNPSAWGLPAANMQGSNCVMDQHFQQHSVILDMTFCGSYAGLPSVWNSTQNSCAASTGYATCEAYVANNPAAFQQAYWDINSIRVYQLVDPAGDPATSTSYIASQQPTNTATQAYTATSPATVPTGSLCPTYNFTLIQQGNLTYEVLCGYDPQGFDLAPPYPGVPTSTFEECVAGCTYWNTVNGTNRCGGVSFDSSIPFCYFKSYINGPSVPREGFEGLRLIYYGYPEVTDNPASQQVTSSSVFVEIIPVPQTYVAVSTTVTASGSTTVLPVSTSTTSFSFSTTSVPTLIVPPPLGTSTTSSPTSILTLPSGTPTVTFSGTIPIIVTPTTSLALSSTTIPTTILSSTIVLPTSLTISLTTSLITSLTTSPLGVTSISTTPISTIPISIPNSIVLSLSSSILMSHSSLIVISLTTTTPTTTIPIVTTVPSSTPASSIALATTTVPSSVTVVISSGSSMIALSSSLSSSPSFSPSSSSLAIGTTTVGSLLPTTSSLILSPSSTTSILQSSTTSTSESPSQAVSSTSSSPSSSSLPLSSSTSIPSSTTSTATSNGPNPTYIRNFANAGCRGTVSGTMNFTLVESSPEMTLEMCTTACVQAFYAGVSDQNCYCGTVKQALDTLSQYPDSACSKPCPGNPVQRCGGLSAGVPLLSVYNNTALMPLPGPIGLTTSQTSATTITTTNDIPSSTPAVIYSPTATDTIYTTVVSTTWCDYCETCPNHESTYSTTITRPWCGCTHTVDELGVTSPAPVPTVPMTTTVKQCSCGARGAISSTTVTIPCETQIQALSSGLNPVQATPSPVAPASPTVLPTAGSATQTLSLQDALSAPNTVPHNTTISPDGGSVNGTNMTVPVPSVAPTVPSPSLVAHPMSSTFAGHAVRHQISVSLFGELVLLLVYAAGAFF